MALDIVLVTDNTRRFERVEGLRIENGTRPS
jgi:predicted nucleic acid-binding protein